MTTRGTPRVALTILAAGAALLPAACDQRSDDQKKVQAASERLMVMTGGSSSAAPDAVRKGVYSKNVSELSSALSGADRSAAGLLVAASHDGLGDLAFESVVAIEGRVRRDVVAASHTLGQWSAASAMATASAAFDPAPELAQLAQSKAEKDQAVVRETARKASIEAELANLRAQAKAKSDASEAKRREYAQRIEPVARLSATEALPLVEAAAEIKRAADVLALEAASFEAKADAVAPRITEIDATIGKLRKQSVDLTAIAAGVRARADAARAQADEARARANAAAAELGAQLASLATLRGGSLASAYQDAEKVFSDAVRSAGLAASTPRGASAGRVAQGSTSLSLAEVYWTKAQGAQVYASLLRAALATSPALPNADSLKSSHAAAVEEQKAALAQAADALQQAKDAFESVPGGASDESSRLAKLGELLGKAVEVVKDENLDAAGKFGIPTRVPKPLPASGGPAGAASPAGDDVAQVRAALEGLFAGQAKMRETIARVDAACQAKFGKSFADVLAGNPMLGASAGMIKDSLAITPADFAIEIVDDETATATAKGMPMPLTFKKSARGWEVPGAGSAQMMARSNEVLGDVFEKWGKDVEGGKYDDDQAASGDLMMKLQGAFMQMMGDLNK